jgi:hypothetical protein
MITNWTKELWDKHLNTRFRISEKDGAEIEAELVQVDHWESAELETLSVLFLGPKTPVLSHDTLTVTHPELGEHALFMGPVAPPGAEGIHYEAVFNRFKEKTKK